MVSHGRARRGRILGISSEKLEAEINTVGAELWSLTDENGKQLLTDADPRWWTGRSPLLFPFVGRSRGERYRYDCREFAMAPHGFARRKRFAVIGHAPDACVLELTAGDETRITYPFNFRLILSFKVVGYRLEVVAAVCNQGTTDMPFSFGFHPALAWPLPFGAPADQHRVTFDLPERQASSASATSLAS